LNENSENVDNNPKRIETGARFCYIDIVFVVNNSIYPLTYQQVVDNIVNIFPER